MKHALARWAILSLVLNLAWELAQLPLYTISRSGDAWAIAYAVAHCTAGDVLIAMGCYLAAAAATRSGRWPHERARAGGAVAIAAGVSYTIFSEWLNVSVRGSWTYGPAMPQVLGIGLAPVAQWLFVPAGSLFALRAWGKAGR